jgi:fatty-acyl-CoA synthase
MQPRTLPHALVLHAARRPGAIALQHGEHTVTWAALLDRVQALTAGLALRGVSTGSRIAALLPNSIQLIELMLAAQWLGASICPLNWRLSPTELARHIAQITPQLLVVHGRFRPLVEPLASTHQAPALLWCPGEDVAAQDDLAALYLADQPAPTSSAAPSHAALLVATSGTSGQPRHVVLSHKALIASARQFIQALALTEDDRQLAISPMFHIAGLGVLTIPLLICGGTSVLSDPLPADLLWERLGQGDITCLFMVPTLWARLDSAADARALPALRVAVVGGAFCPATLRSAWIARGVPLWIGYGMTEAAPMVTLLPPAGHALATDVGLPGADIALAIADPDAEGVGRVCVLAPNLMDGYWSDEEATASALPGDGWLRTEDMGWIDQHEHLHLVGRADDVIISGGVKIHPAEVELALAGMPHVDEVAVVGTPHPSWGHIITAVIHPAQGVETRLDDLHAWLAASAQLARFKWPRRLVLRRHDLPRSGAGKLLRRALLINPREIIDERLPSEPSP